MKKAFTLAEVLITLAIIGVVAALSIPSVISNSQQQEFKTGLRKAVSVLNSAITMNMAIEGETPYDNANLMGYLMRHMSVMASYTTLLDRYYVLAPNGTPWPNAAFYTTDGMRYEFWNNAYSDSASSGVVQLKLHENPSIQLCMSTVDKNYLGQSMKSCVCGSYGLNSNTDKTTRPPCLITVDVNGDRKPNPNNVNCKYNGSFASDCAAGYKYSDPSGKKLTDIFSIMITDKEAIPYGVAAQKAMYSSQK